ncbi:MAG TPA: energy transducer TonB [Pyrinomonadaceae bacterium]|nr:energy transducer TonB [Pyrinomonadaceae bacterium]
MSEKTNQDELDARRPSVEPEGREASACESSALTHESSAALFVFASVPALEEDLKVLLDGWQSPRVVPASLDARVLNSYRELLKEKEMNLHRPGHTLTPHYALPGDYHLTILEERGLFARLLAEIRETADDAQLTRAELRRDPFGFMRRLASAYASMAWRTLSQENTAYGVVTAFAVVLTLVGAVAAFSKFGTTRDGLLADRINENLIYLGPVTNIPKVQPEPEAGTAGMARGTGGGSKTEQERPGGGGGGGRLEDKPAVHGKLPQATLDPQVLAPDPKPPAIQNPSLPTAATIRADPALFPTDTRAINYGDPKSKATELSSGSGTGGGIGEGTGGGVGPGNGTGYGPGEGYNTGGGPPKLGGGGAGGNGGGGDLARPFRVNEVTRRAQIISKPEPLYTEEARKNQVTGTVRLRLVLSASGQVTGITPITKLPDGLTEKAIEAARRISFTPAEKDGRKVSQYVTIEYNFNIY